MVDNDTAWAGGGMGGFFSWREMNDRIIAVQVLVIIFLYINSMLIFTFFKRESFRTNTRYILFAHTLLVDSLFMFLTDFLLLVNFYAVYIPVPLCVAICILSSVLVFLTPLTLTAMSLERYVAICMPLQHAQLSTPRRALYCILVIYSLSSIQTFITTTIFFASVPPNFYFLYRVCNIEMLIVDLWQNYLRTSISQFYFVAMTLAILFTYVKIMAVAKEASAENKKSTAKGLRTVILHSVQLTLSIVYFWCPFVEAAMLRIDLKLYIDVRYINYILFILVPRCMSPLIYGLRDEKFYCALRYFACYGCNKNISPVFVD